MYGLKRTVSSRSMKPPMIPNNLETDLSSFNRQSLADAAPSAADAWGSKVNLCKIVLLSRRDDEKKRHAPYFYKRTMLV
jgi:hypothetical protein